MKNKQNHLLNIFLIPTLVILAGCSVKERSLGADNEIMILASADDRDAITEILGGVFNDTLFTPKPEMIHKLKFAAPDGFNALKRRAYLAVAAIGNDPGNEGVALIKRLIGTSRFDQLRNSPDNIIFTKDQFARDQLFMILAANTREELQKSLAGKEDWIKGEFDKLFFERQSKFFFENARMVKLEKKYLKKYGWKLKVPWGWVELKDSTNVGFVWLGKEMPYQWISIKWENGLTAPDFEAAKEKLLSFPETYYGHVRYNDYKLKVRDSDFKHWTGYKATGVWESIEEAMGGPFTSFLFYDGVTDKTYHINFIVHNPAKEKTLFMRQLNMIANTFETGVHGK